MVMRPAVNGDSGTSDGFNGGWFCKEEEIVGTGFKEILVGANPWEGIYPKNSESLEIEKYFLQR